MGTQLTHIPRALASPNSAGLAILAKVDPAALQSKAAWRKNPCPVSAPLSSLTCWMGRAHLMGDNLLFSECTDVNVTLVYRIPSQKHLDWDLTKQLDTTA